MVKYNIVELIKRSPINFKIFLLRSFTRHIILFLDKQEFSSREFSREISAHDYPKYWLVYEHDGICFLSEAPLWSLCYRTMIRFVCRRLDFELVLSHNAHAIALRMCATVLIGLTASLALTSQSTPD